MPSVSRILELAPVSCYLAANFAAKKQLFGGSVDPTTTTKIYNVYKILKHVYDKDPSYDGLQQRCNYLYELCKKWALGAAAIVDGGGGGSVAPPTPGTATGYPIVVNGSDFEPDGITYVNPDIVGDNIMLFVAGFNQEWHFAPTFFTYNATGFIIVFPGFDANNYDYIIIQNYNP